MENKNMTVAREWENDPNCFLRMLNSPAQQRSRAARRQRFQSAELYAPAPDREIQAEAEDQPHRGQSPDQVPQQL